MPLCVRFLLLVVARAGGTCISRLSLHSPSSFYLLLTLVLFDSTEAEDMEVDGGAAVAAADGITDAVLVAGT
jgi:hypothetical protein